MPKHTDQLRADIYDLIGDTRRMTTDVPAVKMEYEDPDGLSAMQRAFVEEFAIRPNPRQAVIAAGYTGSMYKVTAQNLMRSPKIIAALRKRRAEVAAEAWISAVDVVKEYANIAFSDTRNLFDAEGRPRPVHDLEPDVSAMLKKIEVQETEVNGAITQRTYKYEVVDRMKALDGLARHLGLFVDKVELTGKDGGPVQVEQTTNDKARRVAFLLAQAMQAKLQGNITDVDTET